MDWPDEPISLCKRRKIFVLNKEKAFGLLGSLNISGLLCQWNIAATEHPNGTRTCAAFAADSSTNVAVSQVFGSLTRGLVAPTKKRSDDGMRRRAAK